MHHASSGRPLFQAAQARIMGEGEFLVGFLLAFGGGTLANLGMNIQKLSHKRNDALPAAQRRNYVKRPLWAFGFLLFFAGQLSLLASLGFADQTTCSVLGTLALVMNAVFARLLFGELFTRLDAISMAAIIGGSALVIVFFEHAEQNFTVPELERHLSSGAFVALLTALVGLLLVMLRRWRQGRARALTYAWLAAAIGALSLTFGKVTMQLVKLSGTLGESQFCCFWTFLVPALFAVAALSNVHFLNEGLANCEAMVLVPMYYNLNNIIATAMGIVAFADYSTFDAPLPTAMFAAGVSLMGLGVAVLANKPPPEGEGGEGGGAAGEMRRRARAGSGTEEEEEDGEAGKLSPKKRHGQVAAVHGGVVRLADLEEQLAAGLGAPARDRSLSLDKFGGSVARSADRLASGVKGIVRRGSTSSKRSSGYQLQAVDDHDDDDDDDDVEVDLDLDIVDDGASTSAVL